MKKMTIPALSLAVMTMFCSCSNDDEQDPRPVTPPQEQTADGLPLVEGIHEGVKAPLYWSIYEYCFQSEQHGITGSAMDFTANQWDEVIDWVASELKPYGYDMVCTDGFIPMLAQDASGYMTHYGSVALKDLVAKAKAKGLRVGVYDNPLWIHGARETKIAGTDRTFGQLMYDGTDDVCDHSASDLWFWWASASHEGFEEYIDGFFRHYKELGIEFIRMDFLSWYEDGRDRGMGTVGRGYGREAYAKALACIAKSAKKYGVFTSLVMPHCYDNAELEARYGNMFRIVCDTREGTWWHTSAHDRGRAFPTWPTCNNQFDGFNYWSPLSGRDKVILDGDFIILHSYQTDAERQTVISLNLMAGGPVTVADQPSTVGDCLKFYQNSELLELNRDGFVGKPLSDRLGQNYETWYGQMTDGSYVVGLFNRTDASTTLSVDFSTLGISGERSVRDLWTHTDEGRATSLTAKIPAHGCKIVRLR